jgi:Protein of unknown function (DUF3592)
MKRRPTTYLITWSILAISALFAAALVLRWPTYHGLSTRGTATRARVIEKQPENHRFVRYSYVVGDRTYDGLGNAGDGNPEFDEIHVGDEVNVYYDPQNPETSFLGNPNHQLQSITRGVVFITVVLPLVIVLALLRRDRKRYSVSEEAPKKP